MSAYKIPKKVSNKIAREGFTSLAKDCVIYFPAGLMSDNVTTPEGITMQLKSLSPVTRGRFMLGDAETPEKQLIKEVPSDIPIIELGAGTGYLTSIVNQRTDNKHIAVEPNPHLLPVLESTRKLNRVDYSILPRAYHPTKDRINFPVEKYYKTVSLLDENKKVKKESVKTTSIKDIVKNYSLDNFFLHVDIEGSERLLFQEMEILSHSCKGILIELHPDKIDPNRCSSELEEHFDLIAQRDNVKLYTSRGGEF